MSFRFKIYSELLIINLLRLRLCFVTKNHQKRSIIFNWSKNSTNRVNFH